MRVDFQLVVRLITESDLHLVVSLIRPVPFVNHDFTVSMFFEYCM
jgi:hypothetical protein